MSSAATLAFLDMQWRCDRQGLCISDYQLLELRNFFLLLSRQLLEHIQKETVIFPYSHYVQRERISDFYISLLYFNIIYQNESGIMQICYVSEKSMQCSISFLR